MEKDAAGCLSLPLHYGLTNPGISRYLASRLPYFTCSSQGEGVAATSPPYPTRQAWSHRR